MSDKESLQSVTPYKVMDIAGCFDALGWCYDFDETADRYVNIACGCGGELEFSGFIGTERIECLGCKKHMVDLFSPLPTSNSTCAVLSPKDYEYEQGCHWIAIDREGGIMKEGDG